MACILACHWVNHETSLAGFPKQNFTWSKQQKLKIKVILSRTIMPRFCPSVFPGSSGMLFCPVYIGSPVKLETYTLIKTYNGLYIFFTRPLHGLDPGAQFMFHFSRHYLGYQLGMSCFLHPLNVVSVLQTRTHLQNWNCILIHHIMMDFQLFVTEVSQN